ncbi:unnamed protein product [Closterium sp. Yama58-4]|nr:unnamed protein product [Closterium sp. Yama58-4]
MAPITYLGSSTNSAFLSRRRLSCCRNNRRKNSAALSLKHAPSLIPNAVHANGDFKYRGAKAAGGNGVSAYKAGPLQEAPVPLTLLPDNPFGAKCLDGSPPGYYLRRARPSQSRFWHIHLPGGGWCTTEATCAWRAGRKFGSSRLWPRAMISAWLPGIMSADPDVNPGFGEWNMAMAVYCDGGGYVGRRGEVTTADNTTLHMDGWKIVMAILDDLSSKGLMAAQQVLITGESAGGQAVVNLCDYIAAYLSFATVKCLSDGGFFIDAPDRRGRSFFREIAENATQLHQMFNPKCNQDLPSQAQWRCFFPQYSLACPGAMSTPRSVCLVSDGVHQVGEEGA